MHELSPTSWPPRSGDRTNSLRGRPGIAAHESLGEPLDQNEVLAIILSEGHKTAFVRNQPFWIKAGKDGRRRHWQWAGEGCDGPSSKCGSALTAWHIMLSWFVVPGKKMLVRLFWLYYSPSSTIHKHLGEKSPPISVLQGSVHHL